MALELAGDVAEWILPKIAGKEVTDLKTKIQDAMGEGGTTLQDLDGQLVKLRADQDKILAKVDWHHICITRFFYVDIAARHGFVRTQGKLYRIEGR